jgi:hypothetical protein
LMALAVSVADKNAISVEFINLSKWSLIGINSA